MRPNREIAWPFRIGADGGIASVDDPYRIHMQHLVQLILTRPGERVMLPQFGTEALNMLFGSVDAITGVQLATSLRQAIDLWEPGIKVHDLRPLYEEPNTLAVSVKFSVPPSEEVLSTVVEVGGSVRGEIGG